MRLLVWDHEPRILLDGRRMADVLGIEGVLGVPTDRVRMRNALNAGQPLALARDGNDYLQAIRRACDLSAPARRPMLGGLDKVRRAILRQTERTA